MRRPRLFDTVFIGPGGVRAGWRAGLYVAVVLVLMTAAQLALAATGLSPAANPRDLTPGPVFLQELILFLASLGATSALALAEGHSVGDYGLPLQHAFRSFFWQGTLWGFGEISAAVGLMALLGAYSQNGFVQSGARAAGNAALWAGVFLMVGLGEEFAFRGYLLKTLGDGMGFWPAAIALSILFGAVHLGNPGESPAGLISVALVGLFFSFTVLRTGHLWFAVGAHAAFDFGQAFVYGVPNSGTLLRNPLVRSALTGPVWLTGGAAGPEASCLSLFLLACLFVLFARIYRRPAAPKANCGSL